MGIVVAVVVVLAIIVMWGIRQGHRAQRIVQARSQDLADATGLPAETIAAEIINRRITPGEWAVEHGLDPITFQPVQ